MIDLPALATGKKPLLYYTTSPLMGDPFIKFAPRWGKGSYLPSFGNQEYWTYKQMKGEG